MKKVLLLIGVIAFTFLTIPGIAQFTQTHVCGLRGEDAASVKARMMQNREDIRDIAIQRGAITYVPIKFHLVADNDGEGRIADGKVLDMLCILNDEYLQHEIQFYIKDDFNYFDHTPTYSNVSSSSAMLKMEFQRSESAINVYIIQSIGGNTLAYFQPGNDWIVINSGAVYGENVLPHEVGHFFSLSHPFYGWEDNPWNEADWGNPVGNYAPSLSVPGQIQNDRMDQSNCTIAADGICDTPPDYLFGFVNNGGCGTYTGNVMDFNGDITDPMEDNIMSYFQSCSDYVFTPQQVDAIHVDLNLPYRNYVNPGITPPLDEITASPSPTFPVDVTVGFNAVQFSWTASPGATHYLLEVDRFANFSFQPQYFITTDLAKTVYTLQANKDYFWRVRPFNVYRTCTTFSPTIGFNTSSSTSTNDLEFVDNWTIRPNPVTAQENIIVEMNASKYFDAAVKVYSLTGQLLSSVNHEFNEGFSTMEIKASDLSGGMYIISIQSAEGIVTKKVVVR